MGIFTSQEEADPGALVLMSGSARKQEPTDRSCPFCGRWFSNKGQISHKRNCPVAEEPCLEYRQDEDAIVTLVCENCGENLDPTRDPAGQRDHHANDCTYVRSESVPSPSEAVQNVRTLDY
jgi:hypothetical protein